MLNKSFQVYKPITFLFIAINLIVLLSTNTLHAANIDTTVLLGANLLLLLLCVISIAAQSSALKNSNPNVFIRSIMKGMILKMLSITIAVLIYVKVSGSAYNKKGVFVSLILYLVYLGTEVSSIMKMNKQKNG